MQFKNDAANQTYTNNAVIKGTDGQNVYVKAPEISIVGGGSGKDPDTSTDIHYKLFAGHGDHLGNPLYLWGPTDNIKINHMAIVGYRLMTDDYRNTVGNGTITVPSGVTQREVQYFISHGIISAAEYTSGADATESQIYRILDFTIGAGLSSNSTDSMKRKDLAELICSLTKRDTTPNTNGLPLAYFTDKGAYASLIDEVSNSHDYSLDSSGNETWQSILQ